MWERGYRHNPLSYRYRFYLDHRPILPQDPSLFWLKMRGKEYDPYRVIYLTFRINKSKRYLLLNNIPVQDRENLKDFINYYEKFFKSINTLAYVPSFFMAGTLFKYWRPKMKIIFPLTFLGILLSNQALLNGYLKCYANNYISYFYHKYSHLTVDNIENVEDPRRKFFRLDTTSYYRQTHEEILHKSHYAGHHDHEVPYYGPSPVNYCLNN